MAVDLEGMQQSGEHSTLSGEKKKKEKQKFRHLEFALLEEWSNVLRLNKDIYTSAFKHYERSNFICNIVSGVAKGIAGATAMTALLSDKFNVPQSIITSMTIAFVVLSVVIGAISDALQLKNKSISYQESSKSCDSLIKEIEYQCAKEYQDLEFDSFGRMVKAWMDMISNRSIRVPEHIIKYHMGKYAHTNIVLEAVKLSIP